jgi:hypothetical protein
MSKNRSGKGQDRRDKDANDEGNALKPTLQTPAQVLVKQKQVSIILNSRFAYLWC